MSFERCPLCDRVVSRLRRRSRLSAEITTIDALAKEHPDWRRSQGICDHCLYRHAGPALFIRHQKNSQALLPLPLRIDADPRFSGRGMTIAFLDSGFYPHPDLVKPRKRIRTFIDVTNDRFPARHFLRPSMESWHGTMSAVLSSGSGSLSKGVYRGIADEAEVIGVKVMDTEARRISTEDIARGIRWVLDHREEHNIRLMNISVGGDLPKTGTRSEVDRLIEEVVGAGIVTIVAAGNSPGQPLVPPASAPYAITVGGYDDHNQLNPDRYTRYHSTFGKTRDGLEKPELVGPAMAIAGPILPRTDQFRESRLLFRILNSDAETAWNIFREKGSGLRGFPKRVTRRTLKGWALKRITEMKYVGPYHKRMEGSSVAAALVTSLAAQMLEANPMLDPSEVRSILLQTAVPLREVKKEEQGAGVVNPRAAIEESLIRRHHDLIAGIRANDRFISILFESNGSKQVSLAGDFNDWSHTATPFHQLRNGMWSVIIPKPRRGTLRYKLVLDGMRWIEDPAGPAREPDGFGGWNSLFVTEDPASQPAPMK